MRQSQADVSTGPITYPQLRFPSAHGRIRTCDARFRNGPGAQKRRNRTVANRTFPQLNHSVLTASRLDPEAYLPPNGTQIRDCLVRAARGEGVEQEVVAVMASNAEALPVSREIPVPRPERGFGFHGLM